MAAVAIRLHLEQARSLACACTDDRGLDRSVHGFDVLAVDDAAGDVVGLRTLREVVDRRRGAHRRVLAVQVVLDDEDDRRLPHGGHVERLVKGADVRRPVTEERERHLVLAPELGRKRGADGDGKSRADDRERSDQAP